MICPQCKCQYIRGMTQCSDCGVALVDRLEPPLEESAAGNGRIVPIWQGKDASESERVQEALESADIPFTVPDPKSQFSFLPTEPSLEIWISEADEERARKIISDLEGRIDPQELTPEQLDSLAVPELDAPQEDFDDAGPDSDLGQEWGEDEPVSEAWRGGDEGIADNLIACLREVGIAARKTQNEATWNVVVRPPQESRAKEIVREVVDATPPE
jgi:hypothetical protein